MKNSPILCILFLSLFLSCARSSKINWDGIDRLVCESPGVGLQELDKISADDLSQADLRRYNLLKIKSQDKLYINHTTDSVILDIIDYYSNHNRKLYPEALYYGGRVYSDLGDKPSAIKYYQAALDLTPEKKDNLTLRSNILSQIAQEYLSLKMHGETLRYLEEVAKCDSIKNDSINIAFNYEMIGEIYQRQKNPDKAEIYYRKGLKHLTANHHSHKLFLLIKIAKVQLQKNNLDSAYTQISQIIKETADADTADAQQSDLRNSALSTAVQTYYKTGDYKSVYTYALELAMSNSPLNRQNGFYFLFKPEVMKYIPTDSLVSYIREYHSVLENRYKEHDAQHVVMQNTHYNYETHERERLKAELREQKTVVWLAVAIIVGLLLMTATLYYRNREKSRALQLHKAIEDVNTINKIIQLDNESRLSGDERLSDNLNEQREILITAMLENALSEKKTVPSLSKAIKDSKVYNQIKEYIELKTPIPSDSEIWPDLKALIHREEPYFIPRLRLLSVDKITGEEIKMGLLIKCGFTPGEVAIIYGKKKSALTYHRKK